MQLNRLLTEKPRNIETEKPRNTETEKPRNIETEKPRNIETEKLRNQETQKQIYGVILAGGEGHRLWPVSRKELPKYSICIGPDKKSLLQQAYERLRKVTTADKIFVVTQKSQVKLVRFQLPALKNKNIIIEPFARNTASAVGLASLFISSLASDAVVVTVPADHFIPDGDAFSALVKNSIKIARMSNSLVVVGVKASYPATGYGYIKIQNSKFKIQNLKNRYVAYKVEKFVEKPDLENAKKFVKEGYLWNAGIFVWEVGVILEEIRLSAPHLWRGLVKIHKSRNRATAVCDVYRNIKSVPVDIAIFEKSKRVMAVVSGLIWDDIGTWLSLTRILNIDKDNNVIGATFKGIDTTNSIIISKDKNHLIATYGLRDVVVVHCHDATLICSKDKADRVKELVSSIACDKKTKKYCRSFKCTKRQN